jgi:cytochrome c peroxidase
MTFNTKATCVSCHSGPAFTDANLRRHAPAGVVSEPEPGGAPSCASRNASRMHRTTPLLGAWQHPPYFYNGTTATSEQIVQTYNRKKALCLIDEEVADLVQYLKSL